MADDAIDYMYRMHHVQPDKSRSIIKYAPGITHAPHHPTRAQDVYAVSHIGPKSNSSVDQGRVTFSYMDSA